MSPSSRTASQSSILLFVLLPLLALAAPPLPAGEAVVIAEVAKLLPSGEDENDWFGRQLSLDGDRLAIGASHDDDQGERSGSAYIFERSIDGNWSQVAKIIPLDGQSFDAFGEAVSLDGDQLAVGAIFADDNETSSGSAYVFERDGDGQWLQAAQIRPSDPDPTIYDRFGMSVALDGDRLVVSAVPYLGLALGSAYVFERDAAGNWSEVSKIVASDAELGDNFGDSISLDGDRLAVGAPLDNDFGQGSGSAYAFERSKDGSWSEVSKILPLEGDLLENFGRSVALDGDRLAIGAPQGDGGSAYVFERNEDGDWAQVVEIFPLDRQAGAFFGWSVSLDGGRLAIGAFRDDDNGSHSGSAYVFERNDDGSWSQALKLLPLDAAKDDWFGYSVSLDEGQLAISNFANDGQEYSGAAYIFEPVLVSPQLSISGTCPGEITITSSGNTPRSRVRLYSSDSQGSFTFDGGACEGTGMDLDTPELLRRGAVGFDPGFTRVRTVDEFWCGRYLQMIDEKTCLTSEVAQVPN